MERLLSELALRWLEKSSSLDTDRVSPKEMSPTPQLYRGPLAHVPKLTDVPSTSDQRGRDVPHAPQHSAPPQLATPQCLPVSHMPAWLVLMACLPRGCCFRPSASAQPMWILSEPARAPAGNP